MRRRILFPLILAPLLLSAVVTAPPRAQAEGALDLLLHGTPDPTPTLTPGPVPTMVMSTDPGATPTPSGAFFSYFNHSGSEADGDASVALTIHGTVPGGPEGSYVWAAAVGQMSAQSGGSVAWNGPKGRREAPLVVPITVTLTDGRTTTSGKITITVEKDGSAHVTAVDLPGIKGAPDDFEACLAAGTPVRLADGGSKPIEAVVVGDRLAAYDQIARHAADAVVEQTRIHREHTYTLSLVRTTDGHELKATGNHPLLTPGGQWKHVADLVPGEEIFVFVGGAEGFHAVKIATIVRDWGKTGVVYNLKTTRHDYVAGEILVHNK